MKVIIHASDDVELVIADFDQWTLLSFTEALNDPDITFVQLDIEGDVVHMNKNRIVQVTIKKE